MTLIAWVSKLKHAGSKLQLGPQGANQHHNRQKSFPRNTSMPRGGMERKRLALMPLSSPQGTVAPLWVLYAAKEFQPLAPQSQHVSASSNRSTFHARVERPADAPLAATASGGTARSQPHCQAHFAGYSSSHRIFHDNRLDKKD